MNFTGLYSHVRLDEALGSGDALRAYAHGQRPASRMPGRFETQAFRPRVVVADNDNDGRCRTVAENWFPLSVPTLARSRVSITRRIALMRLRAVSENEAGHDPK